MITKLFVEKNWTTKFICPKCELSRIVDVSESRKLQKAVRVGIKCKCGYTQVALLERRDRQRKATNLKGSYIHKLVGKKIERKSIEVKNLSMRGIRFKFVGTHKHDFKAGDEIFVEFRFSEMPRSLTRQKVIIKSFYKSFISAEFKDKDCYKNDFGFKIFING